MLVTGLLFGIIELARFGLLRYHLDTSTYHAARYLALNPTEVETARAMVRAEVERNMWGGIEEVELYVKSARRDGQCLLIVESQAHYPSLGLSWLLGDPSAESAQAWPQTGTCEENIARALPTRTPTPTLSPTTKPRPPILLDQTEGVAMVNANIRLGPGFDYAIVGRLNQGETVQVSGRDQTATWLQVVPERIGWVYAPLIQLDVPVSSLRVVAAPPLPQRTTAPPPRMIFAVEPRAIRVGECAVLRWNVEGANFVTLNEENVGAKEERKICPSKNERYTLSAGYDHDHFFDREVNLVVRTSNGQSSK